MPKSLEFLSHCLRQLYDTKPYLITLDFRMQITLFHWHENRNNANVTFQEICENKKNQIERDEVTMLVKWK